MSYLDSMPAAVRPFDSLKKIAASPSERPFNSRQNNVFQLNLSSPFVVHVRITSVQSLNNKSLYTDKSLRQSVATLPMPIPMEAAILFAKMRKIAQADYTPPQPITVDRAYMAIGTLFDLRV